MNIKGQYRSVVLYGIIHGCFFVQHYYMSTKRMFPQTKRLFVNESACFFFTDYLEVLSYECIEDFDLNIQTHHTWLHVSWHHYCIRVKQIKVNNNKIDIVVIIIIIINIDKINKMDLVIKFLFLLTSIYIIMFQSESFK